MRLLKYLWFHLVMTCTAWMSDVRPILKLRGWLARPAFARCGRDLQIAHNVTINFPNMLSFGSHVYLGPGSWLHCAGGVTLEDEVQLAPYVVLITGNHRLANGSYRYGKGQRAPIRIGRGSWLAAHVTVTAGVSVGRGTLVAANAVVTKDLPDFVIAGGVPARVIKEVAPDERDCADAARPEDRP
ncbi:MAG: acyltransferase [Phycisphaerales bacterium]|nr:acyltransferase [Phycisphaerales bacterium]